MDDYVEFKAPVSNAKGVHDFYLVFKSIGMQKGNLFNLDWWSFK